MNRTPRTRRYMSGLPHRDSGQFSWKLTNSGWPSMVLPLRGRRAMQWVRATPGEWSGTGCRAIARGLPPTLPQTGMDTRFRPPDNAARTSLLPVMKGKSFTALQDQTGEAPCARRYSS